MSMIDLPNGIDVVRMQESIDLLEKHMGGAEIEPLIIVLRSIVETPEDESLLATLNDTFNELGILCGSILTYAPYIGIILSKDEIDGVADIFSPWDDDA